MLVLDVMTADPVTVRADSSIKAALMLLARHGVTSLPVVTGAGEIRGVVSEADLIRESVHRDPRMTATPLPPVTSPPRLVEEVFTSHPITVQKHDDLATAVALMTSTGIKSLPVVDESDRVVGVVARSDVVRVLARTDQAIEAEIDEMMRELGHPDWLVDVTDGAVEVSGPNDRAERSLADVVAHSVAGVVDVRIV